MPPETGVPAQGAPQPTGTTTTTAPANPAAPASTDKGSLIQHAIEKARSAGKSLGVLATEKDAQQRADNAAADRTRAAAERAGTQPRADDGRFAGQQAAEGEQPTEGEEQQPVAGEGEQPVAGAEGSEGAEGEGGEEVDPRFVVALPNARDPESGEELEVIIEDVAAADALRHHINNGMRREQYDQAVQQLERTQDEIDAFQLRVASDPYGHILESQFPVDTKVNLALSLLTEPQVFQQLAGLLPQLADENVLARVSAEAKAMRHELARGSEDRIRTQIAVNRNVRETTRAVERLIPEDFAADDPRRAIFINDCYNDIRAFTRANKMITLDPKFLPQVLQQRLALYGMEPSSAADRIAGKRPAPKKDTTPNPSAAGTATAGRAGAAGSQPATGARPAAGGQTGKGTKPATQRTATEIMQASQRRRAAASTAPTGAGAPAAAVQQAPKGSTIKDAIAHARGILKR